MTNRSSRGKRAPILLGPSSAIHYRPPTVLLALWLSAFSTLAATYYVNINSPGPAPPYSDWTTAATNIQDAVDQTSPGDLVLVTNGIYYLGGHTVGGNSLMNTVAVTNAVTVRSVNGAKFTIIEGNPLALPWAGPRCVYLAAGASLIGFTVTNGQTLNVSFSPDGDGGGVWCESAAATVSNCVLGGNAAYHYGGGAFAGTITCSVLLSTAAFSRAGGAYGAALDNCLIAGNHGGGVAYSTLNNCTVALNSFGGEPGGALYCSASNCIVYFNTAGNAAAVSNYFGGTLDFCCTTPLPAAGIANFTNAPSFTSAYRLQANSPCINAGKNALAVGPTDLDGNPRISGGTVDVGAYEFQNPASVISYAWLQQYRLATDGSADFADADGDGMNNWKEWICGTNPTNAQSVLRMLPPTNSPSGGITLSWQSVSNRSYALERGAGMGLTQQFSNLAAAIQGQPSVTVFTDTNAPPPGSSFYRIRVWQ